jgi:hypothetical protein
MYLYDWTTNIVYLGMTPQYNVFYNTPITHTQPVVNSTSTIGSVETIRETDEKHKNRPQKTLKRKKRLRKVNKPSKPTRSHHKKNIRNIIPNLARKILSFICSEDSRSYLQQSFPDIEVD